MNISEILEKHNISYKVADCSNNKVGYVFHDELWEKTFEIFEDIYVEMPFEIEEFIEMAIENENYPIDGTMAERLVKTMEE